MAEGDGVQAAAVEGYRAALRQDPQSLEIARRSYAQAVESGDDALALQSAALLDRAAMLPRDGTLLYIADALIRKDWRGAGALVDRLSREGNFSFLAPIVRSWIATGQGLHQPPEIDAKDKYASLGLRYVDEHIAYQALGRGDVALAAPAIRRAIASRTRDAAMLRFAFAAQLAARGAKAEALTLLPVGQANYAVARAAVARGKVKEKPLSPAQGYARLMSRLAVDIASDPSGRTLGLRLARIAVFADPSSAEPHIVAARLLTTQGHAGAAMAELRKVAANDWRSALAQAVRIDALADAGQADEALALARTQASESGAEAERHVRLGRLLAEKRDFDAAAAAFRQAQADYAEGKVPWTLLLFEGSALDRGKRWEQARLVLERAVAAAPEEPAVLNYLGYAQIERRQNVKGALTLIRKANALKPDDPSIADSLGWARFVTGDVAGAVPVLEQAVAQAPADPTINEHLGDALWAAGRRYEARYAWSAAAVHAEGAAADRLAAKNEEGLKPEYAAP